MSEEMDYSVLYQPKRTVYVVKKDGSKEAFNVLCFCYLFIRPAGNLCSQRTLHHWLQIQFLCLISNGLKNRGESQI